MQVKVHNEFKINGFSIEDFISQSHVVEMKPIVSFLVEFTSLSKFITVQTSGSTGKPKPINLLKSHMINSAVATGKYFNLNEGTSALLCMSPEYIAGKMMLVRAIVLGWNIDVVSPSSHPLDVVDKQYDFCAMVPMQVMNSLDKISSVKTVIVGGGVVSSKLQACLQGLKTMFYATYGMTETITHIALRKLNNLSKDSIESDWYVALDKVSFSKDVRGCLVIDAPYVADAKIITNDLVDVKSSKSFKWLGRYDNIVNSGGVKLIPELIEQKLSNYIKDRFFVTGMADEVLGEKLVILVESKPQKDFLLHLRKVKSLDRYEVPKKVYYLNAFIETETKKIQRTKTLDLIQY